MLKAFSGVLQCSISISILLPLSAVGRQLGFSEKGSFLITSLQILNVFLHLFVTVCFISLFALGYELRMVKHIQHNAAACSFGEN